MDPPGRISCDRWQCARYPGLQEQHLGTGGQMMVGAAAARKGRNASRRHCLSCLTHLGLVFQQRSQSSHEQLTDVLWVNYLGRLRRPC